MRPGVPSPPSSPEPSGIARALLAAGTADYDAPAFESLTDVPTSLESVVNALSELGYAARSAAPGYALDPTHDALEQAVADTARAAPVVIVYYTGHGAHPEGDTYYLVTRDSAPASMQRSALRASDLPGLLTRRSADGEVESEQPTALIILDCCFSGSGGRATLLGLLQGIGNSQTWVIASATDLQYAQQGVFATAFANVVRRPRTGSGQRYLSLEDIVQAINDARPPGAEQEARFFSPAGGASGIPPFLPNPLYEPSGSLSHWLSRLRAAPEESTTGFYVTGQTGRVRAGEDLARWLTDPHGSGLCIVTGSPGCGKSALLALPVLFSQSAERSRLLDGADAGGVLAHFGELVPTGTVSVSVHARGLSTDQVASIIAEGFEINVGSASSLLEQLETTSVPSKLVIVVDAVDEATAPGTLLRSLLAPLAAQPGIKVAIGARRHVLASAGQPALTIDLDTDRYQDPLALTDYARQLLLALHEPGVRTPYQATAESGGEADSRTAGVAAAIARRATAAGGAESFLICRLLAVAMRARPEVLDISGDDWQDELPASIGAAFDEDLARLGDRAPVARLLLTALAWARGPGLPWENIWVPVAQALARASEGCGTPRTVSDEDVRWLLGRAGAFIVEGVGPGGRSAFRPFHDLLGAYLRGQPPADAQEFDTGLAKAWRERSASTQRALCRALLDTVPAWGAAGRDWTSAHPYLTTYLAEHARAAGAEVFAALVHDHDFLAVADPATLVALLPPADPALRDVARAYRRVREQLGADHRANAAYLEEASVALAGGSTNPGPTVVAPLYRTLLAAVRRDDSYLRLGMTQATHGGSISSIAVGRGPGGRTVLACGCEDGTVRLWDPATGDPIGQPLTGHDGPVLDVAFAQSGDRARLVSGGSDGTVRLWDAVTGEAIGAPLQNRMDDVPTQTDVQPRAFADPFAPPGTESGPKGAVTCVAFSPIEAPALIAFGTDAGVVRLWFPDVSHKLGPPLVGHTGSLGSSWYVQDADGKPVGPVWHPPGAVTSVAFRSDGKLLASAGADGTVRFWEPATGQSAGPPLYTATLSMQAVAFGAGPDGRELLAAGGFDCTVRLWDAQNRAPIAAMTEAGTMFGVCTVAFGTGLDRRPLLASAGNDAGVWIWDAATAKRVGQPLVGHGGVVNCLAFGADTGGHALIASGGEDGTVRLWDPAMATEDEAPLQRDTGWISRVAFAPRADGRLLLASARISGDVQLWDAIAGTPVGEPLPSFNSSVYGTNALAAATCSDGRLLLAFSLDGLHVWDGTTGEAVTPPLKGHRGFVYAVAFDAATRPSLLASAGEDATVRLWNPRSGDPVGDPLTGHDGRVFAVAWNTGPGPTLLASGGADGTIRLWDPAEDKPLRATLAAQQGAITSLAFGTGPGGHTVLASAGSDATIRLWDPSTAASVLSPLEGHDADVTSVAFLTDVAGRVLLVSSGEITVRLWDPSDGSCLAALRRRSLVNAVAGTAGRLAIGDEEGVSVIEPAL